jgi:hypothetical protein
MSVFPPVIGRIPAAGLLAGTISDATPGPRRGAAPGAGLKGGVTAGAGPPGEPSRVRGGKGTKMVEKRAKDTRRP